MSDETTVGVPPSAPPEPARPPSRRRRRPRWLTGGLSGLALLLAAALVAGFVVHLPYVIISPGDATPLGNDVVAVHGATTYAHGGNVLFLTVRVSNRDPSAWRVVEGWLDPDIDVEKRSDVVGCLTDAENRAINNRLMQQSQDDAKNVALTRLGYMVKSEPAAITVVEACPGVPAHGKVAVGDRVLAVDDHAVGRIEEVAPLVQAHRPGEPVHVTIEHDNVTRTVTVVAGHFTKGTKCVPVRGSVQGKACLGIVSQSLATYEFPIDVHIDTARVSGPSAGLAFALAIIDDLTPGNLTGGKRVAVTGAIDGDGSVHEVGGVEQKAITARHHRVALMIVPASEAKAARRGAGSIRVVGVHTITEALAALRKAGGAPIPSPAAPGGA